MNYVIINGRKSTEINGLLIQSLPPVSKPSIRTQIDVLNGRDGDIVTKLGYSAYDKTMKIGLFGCFDIDEVISYFNTEGEITFSNEPDKVYQFTVVNKIDFKRLLRFREAEVVFHVQPFKHSLIETPKEIIDNEDKLDVPDHTMTVGGVQFECIGGDINVYGTQSGIVEAYFPITPVTLLTGDYKLRFETTGYPDDAYVRLVSGSPTKSFGNSYVKLKADETVEIIAHIDEQATFDSLYFELQGESQNFDVDFFELTYLNTMPIRNDGNIESKPTIKVIGDGDAVISLNGTQMFRINLDGYIEIDTEKMEAYKNEQLMNRSVSGDYEAFALKRGLNSITYSGDVTQIVVSNYSRWV